MSKTSTQWLECPMCQFQPAAGTAARPVCPICKERLHLHVPDPTPEEIARVRPSHEEGIEDRIRALRGAIFERLAAEDRVSFSDLGDNDVLNYVSLLFMAGRREIWLTQETLFGELYISRHPGGKGEPLE